MAATFTRTTSTLRELRMKAREESGRWFKIPVSEQIVDGAVPYWERYGWEIRWSDPLILRPRQYIRYRH